MENVKSVTRSGSRNKSVIVEVFIQYPGNYIPLSDGSLKRIPCNYLKSHLMEKITIRIDYNIGRPDLKVEDVVEEHIKELKKEMQIIHYQIVQVTDIWAKILENS